MQQENKEPSVLEHVTEKEMFEYLLREYMSISFTSTFKEIKDKHIQMGICHKIEWDYGETIHYDILIDRLKKYTNIKCHYVLPPLGYVLYIPSADFSEMQTIGEECYKMCIEPRIKLLSHIVNTL